MKRMFKNRTLEEQIRYLEGAMGYLSLLLGAVIDRKALMEADQKFNEIVSGKHGISVYISDDAKHGASYARTAAVKLMEERSEP